MCHFLFECLLDSHSRQNLKQDIENINDENLSGLSNEVKSKLVSIKPKTLGQAIRIDGITPAAVIILLSHIKKLKYKVSA